MKKLILFLLFLFFSAISASAWNPCVVTSGKATAVAEAEYIVPGSGIVNDTETGSEVIIPGSGIYNQQ